MPVGPKGAIRWCLAEIFPEKVCHLVEGVAELLAAVERHSLAELELEDDVVHHRDVDDLLLTSANGS